jgi:hypothetical protein
LKLEKVPAPVSVLELELALVREELVSDANNLGSRWEQCR